jgi:hypothetical protein
VIQLRPEIEKPLDLPLIVTPALPFGWKTIGELDVPEWAGETSSV